MDVIELLDREEGFRAHAYQDSRGIWTIGHGYNLEVAAELPEERVLDELRAAVATVKRWTLGEQASDTILRAKVAHYLDELAPYPWFHDLGEVRKAAIISMRHQLGLAGLLHFPHMIAALAHGQWELASVHALDSAWAQQTPNRAREVARMLETGAWPAA